MVIKSAITEETFSRFESIALLQLMIHQMLNSVVDEPKKTKKKIKKTP